MKRGKKWTEAALVCAMTAGLVVGACKGECTDTITEKMQEQQQEPITLDWYVNYSWFTTQWGGNLVSEAITDATGVSVNFVTPMGNETEKLNSLLASGSLPDIITIGWWESQVDEMISTGAIYPLNELADAYAPGFWEVADETVVKWYTKDDGNLYCYPNSVVTPQDVEERDDISSNQTFLVRKDIYEAIGSPDMTTPEGFMNAVRKAAELYPEVDGQPLIPIGAHEFGGEGCVSFDTYLQNFLAVPWEENGVLYDRDLDPEYLEWLKVFRQLGEEGYLANDIFVDTRTQMEEKLAEGRYFCMLYQYSDMISQQKILYENHPERIYIAVEGPRNSNGDDPTLPTTNVNGWTITMISKNCKDPERAIKFLEYLMSETGQKILYLGVEGETYDIVDGQAVLKDEVKELLHIDRTEFDRIYGADDAYWMLQNNVMQLNWRQQSSPAEEQLWEWACQYTTYNGQYDSVLPVDSVAAQEDDAITKLWSETLPKLLMAPSEEAFDDLVEEYKEKRQTLGFEHLMEVKTAYMKAAKEKLGME